ncbi:MAG: response regulator [Lachnospiraceae bacterium]|nr:response regulator [Lachnospiraceae bacterium]
MAKGVKQDSILIVDDNATLRALLKNMFKNEYRVLEAVNGREALEILTKEYQSIAIILLDVLMPVMDGMSTLKILKEKNVLNRIPVVLLTAEESTELEKEGYALGAVDLVRKPFNNYIVVQRVKNLIELYVYKNQLEAMVRQQTKELIRMNDRVVEVMCGVVESKEEESPEHIENVKKYTKLLAEKLNEKYPEYKLDERTIGLITKGSVLHDIGKLAIDDQVLKKTTILTKDELEVLYSHTTKGSEMVRTMADIQDEEYFKVCHDICRYHHERYDGKGYPDGLKGEDIPLSAQIVGLADSYDKLTSDNIRRRAYGNREAMQMIMDGECGEFSPKLLECMVDLQDEW